MRGCTVTCLLRGVLLGSIGTHMCGDEMPWLMTLNWSCIIKVSFQFIECMARVQTTTVSDCPGCGELLLWTLAERTHLQVAIFCCCFFSLLCMCIGSWVHCNDARLTLCSESEALQSQAYILFYVRRHGRAGSGKCRNSQPDLKKWFLYCLQRHFDEQSPSSVAFFRAITSWSPHTLSKRLDISLLLARSVVIKTLSYAARTDPSGVEKQSL